MTIISVYIALRAMKTQSCKFTEKFHSNFMISQISSCATEETFQYRRDPNIGRKSRRATRSLFSAC